MKIEQNLRPSSNSIKNEEAIKKLELIKGRKIKIKNIDTSSENKSEWGVEISGDLKNDIKIGSPIVFNSGKETQAVRNINCVKDSKGVNCLIQTMDSVYELRIG